MTDRRKTFCHACWREWPATGPEVHYPDCEAMMSAAHFHVLVLGLRPRWEENIQGLANDDPNG